MPGFGGSGQIAEEIALGVWQQIQLARVIPNTVVSLQNATIVLAPPGKLRVPYVSLDPTTVNCSAVVVPPAHSRRLDGACRGRNAVL